jgi:uncharacterized protein YndB with AHSA1/START domain
MKVQSSIELKASAEKVWPFLIEPNKILNWCITFKKFEYTTEKRSGIGTTFYVEEKAGGPLMKLNFQVTKWAENQNITFKMISGTGVKSYEQSWTLEIIPSGTNFTFTEQVELPFGIVGKLIGAMLQGGSQATVHKMLAELKSLAES